MDLKVDSPTELGKVVRAVRKRQGLRIDTFSALAGLSKQFVADVERGKPTVQFGKVLHLLEQLGVRMKLDVTAADADALANARTTEAPKRRRRAAN